MKINWSDSKTMAVMAGIILAVLAIIPFHAIMTVWLASLTGHYTAWRLWKECLLLVLTGLGAYLVYRDPRLRWRLISYKLHWLLAGYLLLQLLWGLVALLAHQVTAKALGYGWIIDLRFLAFFSAAWCVASYRPQLKDQWPKMVFGPLALVVAFGLLQYFVLPYDVLKHLGYNSATIFPYETVNHNLQHIRIMSTLRGANPLGAYLVVGLSLIGVWTYRYRNWWLSGLGLGGLICLYLSFSRSAWLGLAASSAVIGWELLRGRRARQGALALLALLVVLGAVAGLALRHNATFQDTLFHTNDHSAVKVSSNDGHESALRSGLHDLLHQPLGRGPGTAGPASVYNHGHPGRIAENYFIQLGQEVGWPGLLVFAAINVVVARALWRRRQQSLALGLFASLIGLTIVNLLSHAWADDTLAYLWWGLAGLAIATELAEKDATGAAKPALRGRSSD